MKKRVALALFGAGLGVAGIVGGYEWTTEWRWLERTDDAYLHSDITPISSKVGGHIAAVEVSDNQMVHKGDVLVRIDDRDYRARVEEARATVAARQAALANLDARMELQNAAIAAAEAQVGSASAEVVRSRAELERAQELIRQEVVSRQRLEADQADATKAGAGVRTAQANADAARRQLAVLVSERKMAEAQLAQAQAQLEVAELDLEHTQVVAPVDGLVGNRAAQVGEFVRTGSPLLSVVPVDQVWVEANYKETQVGRMQAGQMVRIAVDSFPGQDLTGHIDSLSPASGAKFSLLPPDNATGNFTKVVQRIPVKILVDANSPLAGRLRPGMSAVVTVDTRAEGGNLGHAAGTAPASRAVARAN